MNFRADTESHTITRRSILQQMLAIPLAVSIASCGKAQSGPPLPSVSLDTFPSGLGRGFPVGTLDGANNSSTGINVGQITPNFRMQVSDKQGLYLSDLAGRPILINFWATWCGPCRLEMPEIIQRSASHPDLLVLAVNVQESQEQVAAFAGDFKMTMPVIMDANAKIRDLYQVRGMPTSVFVDRSGKVSSYREGVMSPAILDGLLASIL